MRDSNFLRAISSIAVPVGFGYRCRKEDASPPTYTTELPTQFQISVTRRNIITFCRYVYSIFHEVCRCGFRVRAGGQPEIVDILPTAQKGRF